MTSSFERIKNECKRKGVLWEDPDFPAVQTSVFYHQTPPFTFQWKRPHELNTHPIFVNDSNAYFDIAPGKMGDRWLVSCLGILYLSKGLFYRVVPADQTFDQPYFGVFRFRIWWCGEWQEVLVDDRLPTINGKLAFLQAQHSNSFWPGLLEKAYAKLHGSYEALKYGTLLDGLADLTGGITESMSIKSDQINIRPPVLHSLLDCTSIITCTINSSLTNNNSNLNNTINNNSNSSNSSNNSNSHHTTASGLNSGTNYRLCSLDKAETLMGDTVQLIRLRDPLADSSFGQTSGYNGDWSSYSNQWERVSMQERDRLLGQLDVGEFWMSFVDFITNFTHLECVHLDSDTARDEPSLTDRCRRWLMRLYQGTWKRGISAGGCRNNHDTFHINPQLQLVLNEREDVIISLNQHSVMEPKVIGFTLYSLNNLAQQTKITECLPKTFFKKHKSLLNSQYTNSRQISQRCSLEAGRYLIMATTFEPAEESAFSVRVLGSSIRLSLLETQTMLLLDPFQTTGISGSSYKLNQLNDDVSLTNGTTQYEPVFLQLADDHKTINCFDLQELLEACLPNDYIRSCANLDVCRQIVCLMDKQNRSRITFNDFKLFMINLKTW
ncbi:hypothetical protein ACKWTF_013312 [Chironomus riparius]